MKLIVSLAVLIITTSAQAQKKDIVIDSEKILGKWVLQNATYSVTQFTKTDELDYAQGELVATYHYHIQSDTLISVDKSNGAVYKYLITRLTNNNLTLKIPRSGTELNFLRKP